MKFSMRPDQDLVSEYIKGNEKALEVLLNRHESKIFAFIMTKVKDPVLAQDFFQDTFIKVINTLKLRKYNEEGKFLPWVMRIAHNLVIDHFRKSKRFKYASSKTKDNEDLDIFDTISNGDLSCEDLMIKDQNKSDMKFLIEQLPEEQKEVVKLRHYYDMSFKEIADFSNVSINTALGRMRYAIINLRKLLEESDKELSL